MNLSHHSGDRRIALTLRSTERARREGGYVMVMLALLLVPLMLMVGFAVDVGSWYSRAADMRRAADAAALAGVVWLPDEAAAETAALAAAARNGFVPDDHVTITVEPSSQASRRLKVTITDDRVGSFFYTAVGGDDIELTRTSFAEYILPVPMGSPRNFFGLGTVLNRYTATGIPAEYLYQSVNPYCTDKENGDRYQSATDGSTCGSVPNTEYRTRGYELYIDAVENRPADIDVMLYDPRYSEEAVTWQVQGADSCTNEWTLTPADPGWTGPTGSSSNVTINGPAQYQTWSSGNWSSTQTLGIAASLTHRGDRLRYRLGSVTWNPWTEYTGNSSITINGPRQYQTRTTDSGAWDGPIVDLPQGQSYSHYRRRRLRHRQGAVDTHQVCVPTYTTESESAVDDFRQSGNEDYTYTLYRADNTPLNDFDNPVHCTATFTAATPFDATVYLGSRRWNKLCTIPASGPDGRWILRVNNSGAARSPEQDGSNQWGVVAKYTNTTDGLCDGRNDAMCPRVYGKDAISVRAAAETSSASFYLAEIAREHAGKELKLELFDPGEGGNYIQIMMPSGTNGNTWTPKNFSWTSRTRNGSSVESGTNVSQLDVTGNKFNGRLVEITVDLSGYNPPSNNNWWQIFYDFNSGRAVTDRTVWSARILGDPVHLVEEY